MVSEARGFQTRCFPWLILPTPAEAVLGSLLHGMLAWMMRPQLLQLGQLYAVASELLCLRQLQLLLPLLLPLLIIRLRSRLIVRFPF